MLHLRHKAEIQLLMSPFPAAQRGSGSSLDGSSSVADDDGKLEDEGERRVGIWRLVRYLRVRMGIEEEGEDEKEDEVEVHALEEKMGSSASRGYENEGILEMFEDDMYF
jgi:hypothetical protein